MSGVAGEWFGRGKMPADGPMFLHLHGGGYVFGSCETVRSLVSGLVVATGIPAFTPEYRLAPEHPFPGALEDAVTAYRSLLSVGQPAGSIVISGDSAGGGLALCTVLALRDRGIPLPAALVALSPWTDLTLATMRRDRDPDLDPMVSPEFLAEAARHYAGSMDPTNPLISPAFADLGGLPPLLIQVGTEEYLWDDAARLADAAERDGITIRFESWEGMFHLWQGFPVDLPEGSSAAASVARWLRDTVSLPGNGER